MRLLIADKLHPRAIEELRSLPVEVVYEPELTRESLETRLQGVGVLIVRSTEVTAAGHQQRQAPEPHRPRRGRASTTIDVRAASKRGIYVANCPGKNASAVAELALGDDGRRSIGASRTPSRRCARASGSGRSTARPRGSTGKTLGIAGLGAIGREVAPPGEVLRAERAWRGAARSRQRGHRARDRVRASLDELASKRRTSCRCTWRSSTGRGRSS